MVTPLKQQTVIQSKSPNLLIAPTEYSQQYQDQLNNALRLYFNQLDNFTNVVNNTVVGGGVQFTDGSLQTTAYVPGAIEAYDLSASIAITSTPTVIKPASFANAAGITYDSATGIFTLTYGGPFNIVANLNTFSAATNQFLYFYTQVNIGAGWVTLPRSGRYFALDKNAYLPVSIAGNGIFPNKTQIRYYVYSNDSKVTLETQTLPTVSPAVYVPAIRIQYAGG